MYRISSSNKRNHVASTTASRRPQVGARRRNHSFHRHILSLLSYLYTHEEKFAPPTNPLTAYSMPTYSSPAYSTPTYSAAAALTPTCPRARAGPRARSGPRTCLPSASTDRGVASDTGPHDTPHHSRSTLRRKEKVW